MDFRRLGLSTGGGRNRPPCETRPGLRDRTVCRVSYGRGDDEVRDAGPFLSVKGAVEFAFDNGADWLRVDAMDGTMLAVYCPEFDGNWEDS